MTSIPRNESYSHHNPAIGRFQCFYDLCLVRTPQITDSRHINRLAALAPANRIGYVGNGGPMTLMQLKVTQEAITLIVFTVITIFVFGGETLRWNHIAAFVLLVGAVYLAFLK